MGIFDRAKEPAARRSEAGDERERQPSGRADGERERGPERDADQREATASVEGGGEIAASEPDQGHS